MNEELADEVVNEIGGGKTRFFEANVLETDSIAAAVKGALAWVKETGMEVGGVIAAAGVSTPAKVCGLFVEGVFRAVEKRIVWRDGLAYLVELL